MGLTLMMVKDMALKNHVRLKVVPFLVLSSLNLLREKSQFGTYLSSVPDSYESLFF